MKSRALWLAVTSLAALTIVGCPAPEASNTTEKAPSTTKATTAKPERPAGVVGFYVLDDPAHYMAKDMESVPTGQVRHLGIETKRWMMLDMMSGFGGTWVADKDGAVLTITDGPTGKTNGKEQFKAVRTKEGVSISLPGMSGPVMRFSYIGFTAPKEFAYDEFLGPEK